jgi:hypothetical protein
MGDRVSAPDDRFAFWYTAYALNRQAARPDWKSEFTGTAADHETKQTRRGFLA